MPDEASAAAVVRQVSARWQAWVTRGRNRSPLLERLEEERYASGR
jgi:hypothetical protein